jgi:hypothetical protein
MENCLADIKCYYQSKEEKTMVNKRFFMGILVLTLVFGICVTGCNSIKVNYYNLGDVSEENCALILVTSVYSFEVISTKDGMKTNESEYRIVDFVKIDGQGDNKQWQPPPESFFKNQAIVRVTPGEHTFTLFFIRDGREIPASITYNCKAGKGYSFTLLAKTYQTAIHTGINFPTRTEIILAESDINEKGTFVRFGSGYNKVARKAEIHDGFNDGVIMEFQIVK